MTRGRGPTASGRARSTVALLALVTLVLVGCGGPFPQSALDPASDLAWKLQDLFEGIFFWAVVVFVLVQGSGGRIARQVKRDPAGAGWAAVGIGAGQMSRVDAAHLAAHKAILAGFELEGLVMASDAFFPFRDGVDAAAEAGVTAIIQPGGSKRDAEAIAAADEHGISRTFTGRRTFRHYTLSGRLANLTSGQARREEWNCPAICEEV